MESHGDFLRSIEDSDSGVFLVEEKDGSANLTVYPPGKKGRAVKLADVVSRLELFGLKGYDPAELQEIIHAAEGRPYPVCPWTEKDPVDAKATVVLSEDSMQAFVEIEPALRGGRPAVKEDILSLLQASGVVFGIDEKGIDEALRYASDPASSAKASQEKIRFTAASGRLPKEGRSAEIRHSFDPNPRAVPKIDPDSPESVDFRKLNVIQICSVDEILAEILPASPGEEGINVKGEVAGAGIIKNAKLIAGKNTVLSADGKKLHSKITGHVRISFDAAANISRTDVDEVLEVENVDYSTGHIDFPGTVRVLNTVFDGFTVKAGGDLLVEKSTANVRLSAEGDVILNGGIVSRDTALVTSGRDIYARYIQNTGIHAGGSVYVEESVMHSRITAGGKVIVLDGRGELIGGETLCGQYVRVKKLGAKVETPTRLTVGLDPDAVEKLRHLEEDYLEKREVLDKARLHIGQMEEQLKKGKERTEKEQETYQKLLLVVEKYEKLAENIAMQMTAVQSSIRPDPKAFVEVMEIVYPGVEINFGMGIKSYITRNRPVSDFTRFVIENKSAVLRHS